MSLDKAIKHKKEKRKAFTGAKAVDATCRNHGSCPHCMNSRLFKRRKAERSANEQLKDYKEYIDE